MSTLNLAPIPVLFLPVVQFITARADHLPPSFFFLFSFLSSFLPSFLPSRENPLHPSQQEPTKAIRPADNCSEIP
ncbi:hypothetical protein HOY80DRAFT_744597 [Tuber brumale]|nr:hypothetical protein HOY80DRAFT_744597 [Tuber brumale]